MKVCGFTIVRNAIKYGYPVIESIKSILPLCDQLIVAVGNSDDGTLNLINSINSEKIVVVETFWDENLKEGGRVLATETNKALDAIPSGFDWCFYIQADEVIHEKHHQVIQSAMERFKGDPEVEGLLFNYLHFWGTYDYIGISRNWYRREIRIIKNNKQIRSYRDAQGFRIDNMKLKVKHIDASVYHYGWVRPPETIKAKMKSFSTLYFKGEILENELTRVDSFDYSETDAVKKFEGSHPEVMQELVNNLDWHVKLDENKTKFSLKDSLLYWVEKSTGYRMFEYKNYKIIP